MQRVAIIGHRGSHARLSGVGAITLDGKATRDEIFVDLKQRVTALTASGRTPGLGTILVGDDPGSQAYVRGKHADCAKVGITSIRRDLPADITTATLNETIDELNANPDCTGYIVQLPLPKHLDENAALERVDPDKDADGLHPTNLGRLVLGTPAPLPCTARGIVYLLRRYDVEIAGAHVVVIGRGVTVGRPLGLLLTRRSENATVTLCHTGTRDLPALTRQADIIVAAVGVPHLLTADMVRPGAAVVDVGVSRTEDGTGRRRASRRVGGRWPRVTESRRRRAPDSGVPADQCRRAGRAAMTARAVIGRAVRAQWPILLVGLIFVVAFVLAGANFWRRGSLLIGIGVGVAAVLRLMLSGDRAGLLVVRSRGTDFLTMATVGAAMVYIASTIDPLGTR